MLPDTEKTCYKLLNVLCNYVIKHEITCAESIYQRDIIMETAPELLEQLIELVGYYEELDEDHG